MILRSSTAISHPNIAFIKYWGNADPELRLPSNGSISMNLEGLDTITSISKNTDDKSKHNLIINGKTQETSRVSTFLDKAGAMYGFHDTLVIESTNNFPMGAGIASSASAYSALAVALQKFYQLNLSSMELSTLARLGSGSACRSIPSGYVEWFQGNNHQTSYSISIASHDHWELFDCILVVNTGKKKIGSTEGHLRADTSPYQSVRVHDTDRRLEICRRAIINQDFEKFAWIIELDSDMMHAVMMTSNPPITYWQPASLAILQEVRKLRRSGIECAYTMDAGPNVHVICTKDHVKNILDHFEQFPGIHQLLLAKVGMGARSIPGQ